MAKKSMKPKNPWQAPYDARNKARGIVKVTVRIPAAKREELMATAEKWRNE